MLIDWAIYGLVTWGLVALLNASLFRDQPASRATAWALTAVMFFVNLLAMTALQYLRYEAISENLGFKIRPRSPIDTVGAFTFAWLFFALLRKQPSAKQAQVAAAAASPHAPPPSKGGFLAQAARMIRSRPIAVAGFATFVAAVALTVSLWPQEPRTFEDCVLEKMKGQNQSLLSVAYRACGNLPRARTPHSTGAPATQSTMTTRSPNKGSDGSIDWSQFTPVERAGSAVPSSQGSTTKQPQLAAENDAEGWTQESTGSMEAGPWLRYDPKGTRYCRYADRTIYRVYPPGVKPSAERANPFCVLDSTHSPAALR